MRVFLAFELPDSEKDQLFDYISEFQQYKAPVNWVTNENLHITLQFIGEVRKQDVTLISKIVENIVSDFVEFPMDKSQLEIIPPNKPRLIWNKYREKCQSIFKLYKKLQYELQNFGFEIDKRPLKLHSTLGRVKGSLPEILITKILNEKTRNISFSLSQITLYESKLRPSGPIYIPIETFTLNSKEKQNGKR